MSQEKLEIYTAEFRVSSVKLAIPTMIFSWYGMNFRHMPELDWQYSYPVVVGGVILGSLLLYLRLKRASWL